MLLQAKKYYNNLVLEKEALVPMISPKILMQSSEKRRRDYQASEEVGEGKGKKRRRSLVNGPRELDTER